jgi:Stress responsive A/B Barrel Domain
MFTLADGTDEQTREQILAGLAELPGLIPEILDYRFGADAGLAEGNHDIAVVGRFADAPAYVRYRDHPAHQAFIANVLRPVLANRAAVQFAS